MRKVGSDYRNICISARTAATVEYTTADYTQKL